ncbi:MAG TPA: MotA/TolQ/ExbB proton channel family protein [Verrucomicrobiales bacterium]|jgi:biopolymer transport protein ExbB|nr:MotA/TolQ/ExbB proton channel family protein [Verrucomicrobiales bacterium]
MKASRLFRALSVAALFLLSSAPFAAAAEAKEFGEKSLWDMLVLGGPVMILLAAFSIAMVWLIIDGAQRSSMKRLMPEADVERARNFFRAGDYVGAYQASADNPSGFNNVIRAGLVNVGDGKDATEDAILSEVAREQSRQSTRLSYLSVIGVCCPMVGLLGTVIGMIKAFGALGKGGAGATQNTGELSEHIGEVLVATASGLFVAIPAFMGFYFLRNRLQGAIHDLENEVGNLFRKFPYHLAEGVHVGDQELYANAPVWIEGAGAEAPAQG